MKLINALLVTLLFASGTLHAAEPAPAMKPVAKPEIVKPTATPAATAPKADARSAAGPVKVGVGSQQNRMKECNKSATGKKGPERKAFMKSCLSTRKT